jgi:hypothetical protein
MSFDAWVVGFGFSRTLIDLEVLGDPGAYMVLVAAAAIDVVMLYQFFARRRRGQPALEAVVPASH